MVRQCQGVAGIQVTCKRGIARGAGLCLDVAVGIFNPDAFDVQGDIERVADRLAMMRPSIGRRIQTMMNVDGL